MNEPIRTAAMHGTQCRLAVIIAIKAMIVLFELVCVLGQYAVFPVSAAVVEEVPETAPGLWPYRIAAVLGILCVEVALAAVWPLLTLVRDRDIFSGRAIAWVDLVIGCACAEGLLVLFVLVFAGSGLQYVDPVTRESVPAALSMPLMALTLVVGLLLIAAFVLLMLVMRSLLTQAIVQRRELEAVI
ncbi:DUF2975 domain-containing protein [Bifidobacterium leontopitheci]|uniref:DUF2975 domain-containing protein n=1 Tax=Bifidobacterium leontopitheci TaxID=2650774 RepID=A0A6I1GXM0_9BIFI|nr:DUF2975 domain-containing protein [Bifidobacterium leontopitheci]KAB7791201.1 hypothetical protein F7D09_0367 [Bifidobacterium leontopitheci]